MFDAFAGMDGIHNALDVTGLPVCVLPSFKKCLGGIHQQYIGCLCVFCFNTKITRRYYQVPKKIITRVKRLMASIVVLLQSGALANFAFLPPPRNNTPHEVIQ